MISVIELLVRLVISMVAVMAVMGIAARLVRRRQGAGPYWRRAGRGQPPWPVPGPQAQSRPTLGGPLPPAPVQRSRHIAG